MDFRQVCDSLSAQSLCLASIPKEFPWLFTAILISETNIE